MQTFAQILASETRISHESRALLADYLSAPELSEDDLQTIDSLSRSILFVEEHGLETIARAELRAQQDQQEAKADRCFLVTPKGQEGIAIENLLPVEVEIEGFGTGYIFI